MALAQEYNKIGINIPKFPGVLMVEPSQIPIKKFDCKIMEDFVFFKGGEKIKADVLPVELGNKLVLYSGADDGKKTEVKFSHIKYIGTSEKQGDFMDKDKVFVKIQLENNTMIMLDFDDYIINEFISLVEDFSKLDSNFWKFTELKFSIGDNFKTTKMYHQTPFLAEGEELLWSFVGTEGVFEQKASFVMALTSFRAVIYYFDTHECECVLLSVIDDVLEMNSHQISPPSEVGSFSSVELYSMRMGSYGSKENSKNQTIGDVVFMQNGEKIITFGQMTNPNGLVDLAKTIKKNVLVQDKPLIINSTECFDYINQLDDYLKNSDWQNAEKLSNSILEKNPNDLVALRAKLGVFLVEQKWEKIAEVSKYILILDPENFDARIQLPEALLNLKEFEEAEKTLKESLVRYPNVTQLLSVKRQIEDFRKASPKNNLQKCNKCFEENKTSSKFCKQCGSKLDDDCTKCGQKNPKNASFCNMCGFSLK